MRIDDRTTPARPPADLDTQIAAYLAGAADERERAELERRAFEDHEVATALESARAAWNGTQRARHASVTDAARFTHRVVSAVRRPVESAEPLRRSRSRMQSARVTPARTILSPRTTRNGLAAVVVVLLCVLAQRAWRTRVPHGAVTPAVVREYATQAGQRLDIALPDGSHAVLAPRTRLRFESTADGARRLELKGEAYFTVVHNQTQPFLVRTGAVTTRVLGTTFDVRRYVGETDTHVAVTSGRVAVRRSSDEIVLAPGMIARMADSVTRPSVNMAGAEDLTAWTRGQLVFHETPVPAMLDAIGRWYGYTFTITDSALKTRHVSVSLDMSRPTETMNAIKAMLGVTMTFNGEHITLRPKRLSAPNRESRELEASPTAPRVVRDSFFIHTAEEGR